MTEIYLIKILFLSAVQGMSEFIPVSSSGLLVIFENILEIKNNNLLINASMHGGSLAAVIIFFYKDLLGLWKNHLLLINLIIATLPVVVIGGLLKYFNLIEQIMNIAVIGYATIFFGICFLSVIKIKKKKNLHYPFLIKKHLSLVYIRS
tara:strand:+ start:43 stop:489 length:447 start_codon:yes stop_codon:yes gene_type:complete